MAAIARGVSRVGHHDFMDTIWKAGKTRADEVQRIEANRPNTTRGSASSGQSTAGACHRESWSWFKAEGDADDAVGNNHGKVYSGRYGSGKVGRAFQFDGTGFVRMPVPKS